MSRAAAARSGNATGHWDDTAEGLPERSDKISEIIARQIVRDIARQDLAPGTMLPSESVMLARFKVGRASLREALRILEVHGLITIKPGPGGGPVVQDVTSRQYARTATFYFHLHGASFRDLLVARQTIEPVMARLAAKSADKEARANLRRSVKEARRYYEAGDFEAWRDETRRFHSLVAGVSGNHILDFFAESLRDLYDERLEGRSVSPDHRDAVVEEHEAIADAILGRRADEAEQLMAEHMDTFTAIKTKQLPGLLDDIIDWR